MTTSPRPPNRLKCLLKVSTVTESNCLQSTYASQILLTACIVWFANWNFSVVCAMGNSEHVTKRERCSPSFFFSLIQFLFPRTSHSLTRSHTHKIDEGKIEGLLAVYGYNPGWNFFQFLRNIHISIKHALFHLIHTHATCNKLVCQLLWILWLLKFCYEFSKCITFAQNVYPREPDSSGVQWNETKMLCWAWLT